MGYSLQLPVHQSTFVYIVYTHTHTHTHTHTNTHTSAHMQWPSTSRSVFDQEKAARVVVDLMYKVHTTHPDLLMLCSQLLHHRNSTKVGENDRIGCILIPILVGLYPGLRNMLSLILSSHMVYFRGSFAPPPFNIIYPLLILEQMLKLMNPDDC